MGHIMNVITIFGFELGPEKETCCRWLDLLILDYGADYLCLFEVKVPNCLDK